MLSYLLTYDSVLVCSALAGPVELVDGKYSRFFDYTDEEGNIHKVDLLEPVDTEILEEVQRNPANNQYLLFTRSRSPSINISLRTCSCWSENIFRCIDHFLNEKKPLNSPVLS